MMTAFRCLQVKGGHSPGARPPRGIRSTRLPCDACRPHAATKPALVGTAGADGSHLRRSACASGYCNTATMERRGDCSDAPGAFRRVLASGFAGRLLAPAAHHDSAPSGLVHARAADLRRCDCAHTALFVE